MTAVVRSALPRNAEEFVAVAGDAICRVTFSERVGKPVMGLEYDATKARRDVDTAAMTYVCALTAPKPVRQASRDTFHAKHEAAVVAEKQADTYRNDDDVIDAIVQQVAGHDPASQWVKFVDFCALHQPDVELHIGSAGVEEIAMAVVGMIARQAKTMPCHALPRREAAIPGSLPESFDQEADKVFVSIPHSPKEYAAIRTRIENLKCADGTPMKASRAYWDAALYDSNRDVLYTSDGIVTDWDEMILDAELETGPYTLTTSGGVERQIDTLPAVWKHNWILAAATKAAADRRYEILNAYPSKQAPLDMSQTELFEARVSSWEEPDPSSDAWRAAQDNFSADADDGGEWVEWEGDRRDARELEMIRDCVKLHADGTVTTVTAADQVKLYGGMADTRKSADFAVSVSDQRRIAEQRKFAAEQLIAMRQSFWLDRNKPGLRDTLINMGNRRKAALKAAKSAIARTVQCDLTWNPHGRPLFYDAEGNAVRSKPIVSLLQGPMPAPTLADRVLVTHLRDTAAWQGSTERFFSVHISDSWDDAQAHPLAPHGLSLAEYRRWLWNIVKQPQAAAAQALYGLATKIRQGSVVQLATWPVERERGAAVYTVPAWLPVLGKAVAWAAAQK